MDPARQEVVLDWAGRELTRRHLVVTGAPVRLRTRPWSTLFRIPTDAGACWLKVNATATSYEAPLVRALASWAPDDVLPPLAVDPGRGLLLMADGGPVLRSTAGHRHWESMVARHAELQRRVAPRVAELLDLGVPDARPESLPGHLDALLARLRPHLDVATRDALGVFRPELLDRCARLAGSAVPASLQHDDLHDGNVFVRLDGGYRFFDWADASVAHPFTVLLVATRVYAAAFELAPDGPELTRLRDAYLEPWSDLIPPVESRWLVGDALRTGPVIRALAWLRAYSDTDGTRAAEGDRRAAGWLRTLLAADVRTA